MKKIRLHVFLLIVSFWQNSHAQDIASVNDSMREYTFQNPQKALEFGFKAIESSDFNNLSWELFDTNYLIGQTLFYLNFEKESFDYLIQALSIFEKLPKEKRLYKQINKPPWILVAIGNGFYNAKQYNKAQAYYIEAIENFNLYETTFEEDKSFGLSTAEGNLAMISLELGEFDKSLEYYNRILDRRKLLNKPSDLVFSYNQFINLYLKQDNIDQANYYLALSKKSFNHTLREDNFKSDPEVKLQYARSLVLFANYFKEKGEFRYALELYLKAKALRISLQPTEYIRVNISIADCHQG